MLTEGAATVVDQKSFFSRSMLKLICHRSLDLQVVHEAAAAIQVGLQGTLRCSNPLMCFVASGGAGLHGNGGEGGTQT